ncbi:MULTISPECIES: sulfotransferase [unclassified Thioclava]|uniref:sulfotransferase family protein n=1 Tax=unclassified Thioclava TaxID=2621713 RepID=UPI0009968E48|nr:MULTISPECIES: sulfotransferase [unclassified Thioclava]OOY06987.1 hypothetical protein BMI89_19950 [Thioclava sp. F36-7]OOY15011.1 hypothetical protein BMI85_15780 [Thioclava sp. DLFJ4-1]
MSEQVCLSATQPVLLIGAGRSGTNLIAMALGHSEELFNVYEQRYVWTKGIRSMKTDVRGPEEATDEVAGYIRAHFERQAGAQTKQVRLVDKTPSNALRLAFCLRVFPKAKVINVIRNPLDNIASRIVELQKAGQEVGGGDGAPASRGQVLLGRINHARDLIKRGNIPLDRIPAAVFDQAPEKVRIALFGGSTRYAERVPGLREIVMAHGPIAGLCHQWRELVMTSVRDGRKLGDDRYFEVFYDDVVQKPEETGRMMTDFLELGRPEPVIDWLSNNAIPETVGNWRRRLTPVQRLEIIERLDSDIHFLNIQIPK